MKPRLLSPGMRMAIPDGDDLLQAVEASGIGASSMTRYRNECPRRPALLAWAVTPMTIARSLIFLALTASCASAADPFTLVSEGRPRSQIVIGEQSPETVRFAAKELRTFVAKMSGAELPVAARAEAGVPAIRLGPAARSVLPPGALKDIRRDGYLITLAGSDLCVVGLDDAGPHTDIEALLARGQTHSMPSWDFQRGTLYGVYRLLESLGMRWFMPGEFGQRVHHAKTLTFSGEIRENPRFISRTVSYWSLSMGHLAHAGSSRSGRRGFFRLARGACGRRLCRARRGPLPTEARPGSGSRLPAGFPVRKIGPQVVGLPASG
jgi:hypothetical protein